MLQSESVTLQQIHARRVAFAAKIAGKASETRSVVERERERRRIAAEKAAEQDELERARIAAELAAQRAKKRQDDLVSRHISIMAMIADGSAPRPPVAQIQRVVEDRFNVTRANILSSRRTADAVRPRQIAMYLSRFLTHRSLEYIGRQFGRDHTTILYAIRKITSLTERDQEFRHSVELIAVDIIDRMLRAKNMQNGGA
jgi:chromosomal replication initiation ATPase DnaA